MGSPNSNRAWKIALRTLPGIVVKKDGASGLMGCDYIDMFWPVIAEPESSFVALMSQLLAIRRRRVLRGLTSIALD